MRLDEKPVRTRRERRLRERRHVLALAAALAAARAGQLHRMRRIEHRRKSVLPHDRKRAHVHDEVLITKGRAALRLPDLRRRAVAQLAGHVHHLLRREKLALLHVDRAPRRRRREQQIGLPAQKRRDLNHIAHRRDVRDLRPLVHIRQHRKPILALDQRQQFQPFLHARPARSADRGAVGFVERAFENQRQLRMRLANGHQLLRHRPTNTLIFQRAGPGDDEQLLRVVEHDEWRWRRLRRSLFLRRLHHLGRLRSLRA